MTHKFELGQDFCTMAQVSYVYSFESYRVDKQTNKQTNKQTGAAENMHRFLLRYDVG